MKTRGGTGSGGSRRKRSVGDLATFGGDPAVSEPLHVGRPNIGDRSRLIRRLNDALDRRWLTNDGPLVREFEETIAAQVGVKHCLATCNGTLALELAIRAAGIEGADSCRTGHRAAVSTAASSSSYPSSAGHVRQ